MIHGRTDHPTAGPSMRRDRRVSAGQGSARRTTAPAHRRPHGCRSSVAGRRRSSGSWEHPPYLASTFCQDLRVTTESLIPNRRPTENSLPAAHRPSTTPVRRRRRDCRRRTRSGKQQDLSPLRTDPRPGVRRPRGRPRRGRGPRGPCDRSARAPTDATTGSGMPIPWFRSPLIATLVLPTAETPNRPYPPWRGSWPVPERLD